MAESINRTVVIDGEDDGLASMLQGIQSATEDMGQVFSRVMEKNSAAIDQMVRSMDGLIDRMEKVQRNAGGGGGGGRAGFMGGMMGGGMMGGIAGGVGAGLGIASFMGIGAMMGTSFSEGRKLDDARHALMAISGARGIDKTVGEGVDIGVSTSDLLSYEVEMRRMRGVDTGENRRRTLQTLQSERAYGLGEGETMGLHSFARAGGDDPSTIMAKLFDRAKDSQLWDVKVVGGEIQGFATLGEKMQQISSMTTSMLRGSANADSGRIVDILGAFGGINMDEFSGTRAMNTINSLDQGIRNPSNQFLDAEIKTSLARANPEMNAYELQKLQGQGIYGAGSLDAIFTDIIARHGDQAEQPIGQLLGGDVSLEAIRGLIMAFKDDPDMFKSMGKSKEEVDAMIAKFEKSSSTLAGRVTGSTAQVEARSQDTLGAVGLEIIEAFSDSLKAMLDEVLDWLNSRKPQTAKDVSVEEALSQDNAIVDKIRYWVNKVVHERILGDTTDTWKDELIDKDNQPITVSGMVRKMIDDHMKDRGASKAPSTKQEAIGYSGSASSTGDAVDGGGGSRFFATDADYIRFQKSQDEMNTTLKEMKKLMEE